MALDTAEILEVPEYMINAPRAAAELAVSRHQSAPALRGTMSLDKAQSMLRHIDPDDRDQWLKVGLLLGKLFIETEAEGEAWSVYSEWAARSDKFDEARAQNIERMREQFYEASQQAPRAGATPLGIGTLMHWAKKGGWTPSPDARDADHYRLAQAVVDAMANETGSQPVFAMGAMWCVDDALWHPMSMDDVAVQVGRRFGGGKVCRRGGDFNSVARLAAGITADESFFAEASIGIAAPSGFWHVDRSGEIRCEALQAEHRQRMRVAADPVIGGRPAKLLTILEEAFAGHAPNEQIQLLQQLTGCALTRALWQHRIAALLNGVTSSGKSTYLNVLQAAFPPDQIAATSPTRWANEYYLAALAGKALNIVGELDDREPIPGGAFKAITGRDRVQGRHPTHRPFSFVCEAAHFFNSNRNPPTTDRDDAFFRRWRILHFANAVPPDRERRNLDDEIIATEFGEFLGWALDGAAQVVRSGNIIETEPHRRALARWRVGNNSALEFLLDPNECVTEQGADTPGQALFTRYRTWAENAGVRPFGRSGFYEAIEKGGALAAVGLARRDHQVFVDGVRLNGAI